MKNIVTALACAASIVPAVAGAQAAAIQPAAAPAATPIATPTYTGAVLRTGTEVPLKLREELTTRGKKLRVGQRFQMETAENVIVNGVTVIPVGSPAVGEITDVRNKGMWGKSGHLNARVLYVSVNGRQIRMTGGFDDKGVTGTAGVVAAIALVPIAGFFTTGTSAKIPLGSGVKGFIDEDVPLSMPAAAQTPMIVGAPPAPMTIAAPVAAPAVPAPALATAPAAAPKLTPASTPLQAAKSK